MNPLIILIVHAVSSFGLSFSLYHLFRIQYGPRIGLYAGAGVLFGLVIVPLAIVYADYRMSRYRAIY